MRSALKLVLASRGARKALRAFQPAVLFSTGGYSAVPVMLAARARSVPYVLFEANSVPGRSIRAFAQKASAVAGAFASTQSRLPGARFVRTGAPIRAALRAEASRRDPEANLILVVGGSQGSAFLNGIAPRAGKLMEGKAKWLHVSGKAGFEACSEAARSIADYEVRPFLEASEMASAYRRATVVFARSGGSLAELALFGLPSVLTPYPQSAANHQLENALEFERMGAAKVVEESDATPKSVAAALQDWLADPKRRAAAAKALGTFDNPNATADILDLVEQAGAQ